MSSPTSKTVKRANCGSIPWMGSVSGEIGLGFVAKLIFAKVEPWQSSGGWVMIDLWPPSPTAEDRRKQREVI